jgi:TetR/AcrR family transcriptional regulator, cholesterol catabolism regulator
MTATKRPAPRKPRRAQVDEAPVIAGVPLSELASVNGSGAGPRSKRGPILEQAVALFGESGFEATKWSDISAKVGIGQPALYHYFESKAHCLLTIMRLELARSYERFLAATADKASPSEALQAALLAAFDLSEPEVRQLRILMANGDVLVNARQTEREERERELCLALAHVIEAAWTDLMRAQIQSRKADKRDPKMLALAVLGFINSVWRWYRPGGRITLRDLSDLYVAAALRIVD